MDRNKIIYVNFFRILSTRIFSRIQESFKSVNCWLTFYRATLCYGAVYAMGLCLSVCLSQVGVLLKRLNIGSHKQHHTCLSGAKDLREIRPESTPAGAPNAGGWVKIGDFRRITGYISKTAPFLLKSNRKSHALYRMVTLPMTLSDP